MIYVRRALPIVLAACLLPCSSAMAAPATAKVKHPKPVSSAGHVGIGSAWGPVVVRPPHTSFH